MKILPPPAVGGVRSELPQYGFFTDVEWANALMGSDSNWSVKKMRCQIRKEYVYRKIGATLILHTLDFYRLETPGEEQAKRVNSISPRLPQCGIYTEEEYAKSLSIEKATFHLHCRSLGIPIIEVFQRERLVDAEQFFAALPVIQPKQSVCHGEEADAEEA